MSTPLAPPNSLDQIATLAGAWAIQVKVDDEWEWVIGATSFDLQTPKSLQNAGDINFGQWGGQLATEVNWSMTMNLLKKLGPTGIVPTSTTHLLERAVGVGLDGMTEIRCWRTDGFPEAWEGRGDVSTSGGGGDKTALNSTSISVAGYGPLVRIDKPVTTVISKTFKVTGAPTGGTFTVTVDGNVTNTLARNVSAPQFQSALEALPNVGEGNVTVTGDAVAGLVATFGVAVTTVTAAHTFTGGTTPGATVT